MGCGGRCFGRHGWLDRLVTLEFFSLRGSHDQGGSDDLGLEPLEQHTDHELLLMSQCLRAMGGGRGRRAARDRVRRKRRCRMPDAVTAEFTAASPEQAKIVIGPATAPTTEAVATSQVVLGMPRELARAIGWPKALTPATTQNLLNRDVTWKSLGHPEWGTFRITSADPTKSLVGAVGFGALTTLANGGKFLTKAPNYANPTKADYAVVHWEQRIETVTDTQDAADAAMDVDTVAKFVKSTSAVVTTERAVIAHNQAFRAIPSSPSRSWTAQRASRLS